MALVVLCSKEKALFSSQRESKNGFFGTPASKRVTLRTSRPSPKNVSLRDTYEMTKQMTVEVERGRPLFRPSKQGFSKLLSFWQQYQWFPSASTSFTFAAW